MRARVSKKSVRWRVWIKRASLPPAGLWWLRARSTEGSDAIRSSSERPSRSQLAMLSEVLARRAGNPRSIWPRRKPCAEYTEIQLTTRAVRSVDRNTTKTIFAARPLSGCLRRGVEMRVFSDGLGSLLLSTDHGCALNPSRAGEIEESPCVSGGCEIAARGPAGLRRSAVTARKREGISIRGLTARGLSDILHQSFRGVRRISTSPDPLHSHRVPRGQWSWLCSRRKGQ